MSRPPRPPLLPLLLVLVLSLVPRARADDSEVPPAVQAELLAKVAAYDRNLAARAGEKLTVLVVSKAGSSESSRVAKAITEALGAKATIAGLPHAEEALAFESGAALAAACKAKRAAIVYVAPGFSDAEISSVGQALDGVDVLSVSGVAGYVKKGIVLGFDLVSGKPKLVVDLPRATRQRVSLSANVLRLMTVYQ